MELSLMLLQEKDELVFRSAISFIRRSFLPNPNRRLCCFVSCNNTSKNSRIENFDVDVRCCRSHTGTAPYSLTSSYRHGKFRGYVLPLESFVQHPPMLGETRTKWIRGRNKTTVPGATRHHHRHHTTTTQIDVDIVHVFQQTFDSS